MLNNLFTPKNKRPAAEYFLAVEIHESMIKSAVWQVENETPSIVSLGSYELWDSENSLINGVDASLTSATKGLAVQPDRVIFGLPDSWLVDNKIHSTKQKLIQRLIKELSLKPIGLVTISEAIVSQLKSQEGVPPTAILLEIYPSKVIVSLVNVGQIQAIEEVGRSDDLARDVEEGLARYEVEKLPARFILTNGSDLENEEQQIISYPWSDKLPFIHLPKVQALPIEFSIKAIALSGGSEAAKSLGIEVAESLPTPTEPEFTIEENPVDENLAEIGFAVEEEVQEEPRPTSPPYEGGDREGVSEVTEKKRNFLQRLPHVNFRPRLHLPSIPRPNFSVPGRLILVAPPALAIVLLAGVVAYYFLFGRVVISLSISPQKYIKDIDVAIASEEKAGQTTIISTPKTVSAKASDSISTTGETVVGEKATGKITIYSKLSQTLNLTAGTKITSPSNQTFILDSAVSIASSSASSNPPFAPGIATVSVTASKIGAENNLDKGLQFNIDKYPRSDVVAVNDSAFSGGTSRTVKAVAKADQEKVLGAATNKVKSDIEEQLRGVDPDSRFVSTGPLRYSTKNFDHNVNEAADSLAIDLEGQQDILIYSFKKTADLIVSEIEKNLQPGQIISKENIQIALSDPTTSPDGNLTTKAHVDAPLLPVIDKEKIINLAKGKEVKILKSVLESTLGFRSAKLSISPQLPILVRYLPLNSKNITINISAID